MSYLPFKHNLNKTIIIPALIISLALFLNCGTRNNQVGGNIEPGAWRFSQYIGSLEGKRIGLIVNHSSLVGHTHMLDTLLSLKVDVVKVFAPEHGFRGNAADGDVIEDKTDSKTGIPIISLYGQKRKPSPEDLTGIDVLIFDMQDVGTRFYTYSSTMFYAMEAAAENNKHVIILDRPNPHGGEVDGPVLNPKFKSFIGLNKIPILHGLTLGEMAQMINGEGWLKDGITCNLTIVTVGNYSHDLSYSLPIAPSPNLPNDHAVAWYPTLALFEGTQISVARGTPFPFQATGYPDPKFGEFSFTPISIEGVSTHPPHLNEKCYGMDLRNKPAPAGISLQYLIDYYNSFDKKNEFFRPYFNLLAGTDELMTQIKSGMSESDIKKTWQKDLILYQQVRKKYLLYPDHSK